MPTLQKQAEIKTRRPARMEALASLPVFFQLKGRKVLLAGGTDAAAWKAELLAASGAEVHVYALELDPAMEQLLAAGRVNGAVVHHARNWDKKALQGMALAIADAESDEEALAFYEAAKEGGVPVNVIDNPPYCEFQFGSIVNRSPVVIGISTNGVAPILGQAIRRRVETLLPIGLSAWAKLAGTVRNHVMERLAAGAQRRHFWEIFTDHAFSGKTDVLEESDVIDLITTTQEKQAEGQGKVTLVGAGPGAAELLTLKAVRALQGADVILFDDLVSDEVLELARREAKRMLVGKRGGRESCKQEDINATMIALARSGKNVVRLKSGDPTIFGRAGEEIECLRAQGIPVSVVPGITSASAMAAESGVSLTHRDHAQAVRFVTGHSRQGHLPETLNWQSLADTATTTIFYMGRRMAGEISARLIAEGAPCDLPVLAVSSVSRPEEMRWAGKLSDLEAGVATLDQKAPVLIGVGKIFQMEQALEDGHLDPVVLAAPANHAPSTERRIARI